MRSLEIMAFDGDKIIDTVGWEHISSTTTFVEILKLCVESDNNFD